MNFTSEFLTEKGNLRKATVDGIKAQAIEKMAGLGLEATENGEYAVVLGHAEDGTPFFLTVSLTVGKVDPFVKREVKAKEKAVAVVPELPEIFG